MSVLTFWEYSIYVWLEKQRTLSSVQFSCLVASDSMDCSMPGFPVHHQLPELAQIHVHWVSDAIQPSHPLLSPSPPAFYLSQCQGLFQWVSSSHQVATVLELQHQSFQGIFRLISCRINWFDLLAVQGILRSLLSTTVRKHQFFGPQSSLGSNSHILIWTLEKP